MASKRRISDTTWRDAWFQSLSPNEKLVWIYILTNEHLEISGVYELTIKTIQMEIAGDDSEIPRSEIKAILDRFVADKKILYRDHYIGIVNFHQHNSFLNNPNFEINITNAVKALPDPIRKEFIPTVFGENQNAVLTPSKRRIDDLLNKNKNNNKNKTKTKTKNNNNKITGSGLSRPPEPGVDYDPKELEQSITALKAREHKHPKADVVCFDELSKKRKEMEEKIKRGEYKFKSPEENAEYERVLKEAKRKETTDREDGIRKARAEIREQIEKLDKIDINWWQHQYRNPQKWMPELLTEYPDWGAERINWWLKCIARQLRKKGGDRVGKAYVKSAMDGKWKPEGAE